MFIFSRDNSKVKLEINTSIGWTFTTSISCTDEPYAILLMKNMNDKMYEELTRIRREAYEQGWKDKSRKQRKSTWWTGRWN